MNRRGRAELALAGVTVIWGASFVVIKDALDDVSPLLFIALRFSIAALVLAAIYRNSIRRDGIAAGILAGCVLFAAFACQTIGIGLTTPSHSAFLTSLSIPMVPLAGSLVYRSKPQASEVFGVLVASAGMLLMSFPAGFMTGGISRGDLLSFFCAVLFAFHIVVLGHFAPVKGYESIAVMQVAVVAVLGWSMFWFAEPVRFRLGRGVVIAVLATALLATALAFTTMTWAQQYTSATRAALIFALEPVVAWLTSWIVTGERMPNRGKVGASLILAGILLVELMRAPAAIPAGVETTASGRTS